jgi:hypothetical protein
MQASDQLEMDKGALASLFMLFSFNSAPSGIAIHIVAQLPEKQLHHASMAAHSAAALSSFVSASHNFSSIGSR